MDSVRLNSSVSGLFPYYAPYQSSDLSAECLPGETPSDSSSGRICQAGASGLGDSVSISPQARRMYDASASSADLAAAAPAMATLLNMPAENIALYNQLRRERDTLSPGDPRVIEITGKLRAVLMAGDNPLPLEDRHHVRHAEAAETSPKAGQDTGRDAGQSAKQADAGRETASSASDSSKSRHDRRESRAAAQQAESSDAARPVTAGTSGASDTTEGVPLFSHASASFSSPRLYGASSGAGTFDRHNLGMSASGRLYRVA